MIVEPDFSPLVCSCDNHFYIEAMTPETESDIMIEFKAERGHEHHLFKDEREKDRQRVLQESVDWGDDSKSDDDFKITG